MQQRKAYLNTVANSAERRPTLYVTETQKGAKGNQGTQKGAKGNQGMICPILPLIKRPGGRVDATCQRHKDQPFPVGTCCRACCVAARIAETASCLKGAAAATSRFVSRSAANAWT